MVVCLRQTIDAKAACLYKALVVEGILNDPNITKSCVITHFLVIRIISFIPIKILLIHSVLTTGCRVRTARASA